METALSFADSEYAKGWAYSQASLNVTWCHALRIQCRTYNTDGVEVLKDQRMGEATLEEAFDGVDFQPAYGAERIVCG